MLVATLPISLDFQAGFVGFHTNDIFIYCTYFLKIWEKVLNYFVSYPSLITCLPKLLHKMLLVDNLL